jgi:hypothetical protein
MAGEGAARTGMDREMPGPGQPGMSRPRRFTIGFGLAMIAFAIGFMIWDHQRIGAASGWPSTEGRVFQSSVAPTASGRTSHAYTPIVRYEYRVGGRTFRNASIYLTAIQDYADEAGAQEFLQPYPVGAAVAVHYNPANPQDAALLIESQGGPMIFIILIGLAVSAGGYYWPRFTAWAVRHGATVD